MDKSRHLMIGGDPSLTVRALLAERRKIGAYYTPQTVTDILSAWAIRNAGEVVLEPGFGGCSFLESSANRLRALGCPDPSTHLYGCDIDSHAFHTLHKRLGLTQLTGHFILGDFLSLSRADFQAECFDVVIGNPPYIRHHHIVGEQKEFARKLRDRMLPSLNLQANLWAHFVLHACEFLRTGGRAAWILPSGFAYAYYAKSVWAFICDNFASVTTIALAERLFEAEGAAESSIIVVAEGWKQEKHKADDGVVHVQSVSELRILLSGSANVKRRTGAKSAFEKLTRCARPLGDFCKLSIGVVTGDASFFLFNREKADTQGLDLRELTPIVSRSKLVPGISVSAKELKGAFERGASSMILDTGRSQRVALKRYIKSMPKKRIKANLTFNKRAVWHRPLDETKSDAFFTCMSHYGPRLVLNKARGATCTNTLYRAAFKTHVSLAERQALSVSLISSFGQLSAENCGRCYGAGMLKHEPSEAEEIRIILPIELRPSEVALAFEHIDALLKMGRETAARLAADRFLISTGSMSKSQCRSVRRELKNKRVRRWQRRVDE